MSEFMFGVMRNKPSRAKAKQMDKICREEGGYGLNEVNIKEGSHPGVNNGKYQGWFSGPNRGNPFDQKLAIRVSDRIANECK